MLRGKRGLRTGPLLSNPKLTQIVTVSAPVTSLLNPTLFRILTEPSVQHPKPCPIQRLKSQRLSSCTGEA